MHASTIGKTMPLTIRAGAALLEGDLTVPERAHGLVLFAHGSGSSRFSARPGATHLFEEPGALEDVARLALRWCRQHLAHAPLGGMR